MSCNDCDAVYIGETCRILKQRTEEHRKDVDKAKVTSDLHVQSTGHSFNFMDVGVIGKSNNVRIRRKLGGIHSFKATNTINITWDVNAVYHTVV